MKAKAKSSFNLILLLFLSLSGFAQKSFKYQAEIRGASEEGFYKIYLQPDLISRCKADLSDLRIINKKGAFVPYASGTEVPVNFKDFIAFPQKLLSSENDTASVIVVENESTSPVNSLVLKLKNTAVERYADLLGSDDAKIWYAIKEEIPLIEASETEKDNYYQSLSFPASSYKYFKIRIENKRKSPVNVLQVGVYKDKYGSPKWDILPQPQISKKANVDKVSYLTLNFKGAYQIDKLQLVVRSPKYFKRSIRVYTLVQGQKELISETELISSNNSGIPISVKSQHLQIEIENEDNSPLLINEVQAWQKSRHVLTYLESDMQYRFIFGDNKAEQPNYDLGFFTDSTHSMVTVIQHSPISINPLYSASKPKIKTDYTTFMWIGIALAIILLSFLTWKMLGEMKEKGN